MLKEECFYDGLSYVWEHTVFIHTLVALLLKRTCVEIECVN